MESGAAEMERTVTLPWDGDRPLLFAAPARTLECLRAEFTTRETILQAGGGPPLDSTLGHLCAHIFGG